MRINPSGWATLALASLFALSAGAQQPAADTAPIAPQIGAQAPDFSFIPSTRDGVSAAPMRLSDLKGQTVVLAFFPRARTRGCTVQMEAYRDQRDSLFGNSEVTVIAISTDADTTLAAWARELDTPITFASDAQQEIGRLYAANIAGRPLNARHLYVVGPDGRIAHRMAPFNELSADAYIELGAIVRSLGDR
jgi:thioredoxin-dependent peroxiredoxin